MSILRRDLLALGLALGAAIAGLVVWDYGKVDLGMTLSSSGERVFVADVRPDGNAARNYFYPGIALIDLTTVDGVEVERGGSTGARLEGWEFQQQMPWEYQGTVGEELHPFDEDFRWPIEAVEPARIATAVAGDVYVDGGEQWVNSFASIDRGYLEFLLRQSIWLLALGIGLGVAAWRVLVHGVAGAIGRDHAILLGAAVATPFLLVPVVQVGTTMGIFAGFLVPVALSLMLGLSLARSHPDRAWAQTGAAAAIVAAGLAAIFVVRYMTSPALAPNDRGAVLIVIVAIALVPAIISASTLPGRLRDRGTHVSLALAPGAALLVIGPPTSQPILPILLLIGLLGWQLLPVERGIAAITEGWGRVRPSGLPVANAQPRTVAWRDWLTLGLLGLVTILGIGAAYSLAVIIGVALAALVGFGLRRGFLGPSWTDAAIPLAASVGIPVVLLAFGGWDYSGGMGWASIPAALGSLSVAHVLASRHTDPEWRKRLYLGSGGLVVLIVLLGASNLSVAIILAALVPLIPGLPAAFAEEPGETRALTSRLETLVVTLTPGAAATVLFPTNGFLLGAWLVAVVIWRQFTLNPLLGLARRTEMQRDVAVAAAETERARLAADLHDDALQQLTMLVRKLDEGGQNEAAEEAREIATKLRSVVGDLRLPILDDLGAGAALEWLVQRVEPLAGGSVKLERSDETRPPANVELAVFRVAQEALTNAIKHGKPPIAVRYDVRTDGRVTLAIDDAGDGIGSEAAAEAPHQGHFGLLNMQQRAEQIGALLDVRRWPAGGTRVALEWRPQ